MQAKFDSLVSKLTDLDKFIYGRQTEMNVLLKAAKTFDVECQNLASRELSYIKLQKFFQTLGTQEQTKLQRWLEQIITMGLQNVFGSEYSFVIPEPEIKGNEVAISFKVLYTQTDGTVSERDPYTEMGGGIVDVLSFLLQFVIVFLLRDRIQPILFLDEGFKFVSEKRHYREKVADLLHELVTRTEIQIVLITHDPVYQKHADKVYSFSKEGSETIVDTV